MKQLGFYHVISLGKESIGVFLNDGSLENGKIPRALLEDFIRIFKLPIEKVLSLGNMQDAYDLCNESFLGFCGCLDVKEDNVFSPKQYVLAHESASSDRDCSDDIKKAIYKALDFHLEDLQQEEEDVTEGELDVLNDMQVGFVVTYDKDTEELEVYTIPVTNEQHLKHVIGRFLVDNDLITKNHLLKVGIEDAVDYVNQVKGFVINGGIASLSDFNISLTPNSSFAKKIAENMGDFKDLIKTLNKYK